MPTLDRKTRDTRLIAALRERAAELRAHHHLLHVALRVENMADQIEHDWSGGWARRDVMGVPEFWGFWQTPEGKILRAYRGRHNRVRFYDGNGRQVGPEQRNVAPAFAYAVAQQWSSLS